MKVLSIVYVQILLQSRSVVLLPYKTDNFWPSIHSFMWVLIQSAGVYTVQSFGFSLSGLLYSFTLLYFFFTSFHALSFPYFCHRLAADPGHQQATTEVTATYVLLTVFQGTSIYEQAEWSILAQGNTGTHEWQQQLFQCTSLHTASRVRAAFSCQMFMVYIFFVLISIQRQNVQSITIIIIKMPPNRQYDILQVYFFKIFHFKNSYNNSVMIDEFSKETLQWTNECKQALNTTLL